MFKNRLPLLRRVVICVFVIGLSAGLLSPYNVAYARSPLKELQAQIAALQAQVAILQDQMNAEQFRLFRAVGAEILIDENGTISLTDTSGAVLRMDAENDEIIVEDANGNIMTMNSSGTKVEDSNGNIIEMAASGITVEGLKIVIKGGEVHLGDAGGEPVIKGKSFLKMFATHIHTVAPVIGGPTSPPIPQGEMSTLSSMVMTQ